MGTDLLDQLYEELAEAGGPLPIEECASRYLRTGNLAVAVRVLTGLLSADGRFQLSPGLVRALPPKRPFAGRAIDSLEFAVLDFETNGLGPVGRAIEVGVTACSGGKEIASFESLVNPGTPIAPFVQVMTGIGPEQLAGKPSFSEIWPALEDILRGRVLVAHNLPFDGGVLRNELAIFGAGRGHGAQGLCTLKLSRRLHPAEESHCLDALAARHGLSFHARHRALDDARVTSRLLWLMLEEAADRFAVATWDELERFLAPAKKKTGKQIHRRGAGERRCHKARCEP